MDIETNVPVPEPEHEPIPEQTPDLEYHILNFEEGNFKTTFTRKFATRKPYAVPDPKMVGAFIPGTIVKIFVKEKHKVKKGDPLLTFAAMKMNNVLHSPITGKIRKINVKAGATFTRSQILIEFE